MKRCYFSIADKKNLVHFEKLKKTFQHFNPNEELLLVGEDQVKATGDLNFYYRATPYIAKQLMDQGYDQVCKLDADQLIFDNLDHIWEEDVDVAVVNNSSPKDYQEHHKLTGQQLTTLDIHPLAYLNNGLVVMKSKKFVEHWLGLCYSEHFASYQFREQDFLNMMVFYMTESFGGPYKVKFLDNSPKWHGTVAKMYTPLTKMVDGKVILPANGEWPKNEDKQLVVYHFGGGPNANKGNYRLIFPNDVVKFIDELLK